MPLSDADKIINLEDLRAFKNKIATDLEVVASGSTEGRTLPERAGDVVNVRDFGAKGDGVTDDAIAIQRALDAGIASKKVVFFPAGLYVLRSSLTVLDNVNDLCISATDATIKLESASSIQSVFNITAKSNIFIDGLRIDANRKSYIGFNIRKDDTTAIADLYLNNVSVENIYRSGTEFSGGDGILVVGEFRNVKIINPVIKNCIMAAGAGISGSQGIFGITTSRLSKTGTVGQASNNVYIENPYIENVYCEDPTYIHDQDGIRCFSNYEPSDGKSNPDTFTIAGGYFSGIRGRAVKGQTHNCNISNLTIVYGNDPAGFSGILSNKNAVDMQVGCGNISNVSVFADGVIANSLVRMDLTNTEAEEVHGSGNISNIRVTAIGLLQADVDSAVLRVVQLLNSNNTAVQEQVANISNITFESNIAFTYAVTINTGSSSDLRMSANVSNVGGNCSTALVNITGSGECFCNLVNGVNTGANVIAGVNVNDATKHKYELCNCRNVLNPSKLIVKGDPSSVSYTVDQTNDALVVVRPDGNTNVKVLGGTTNSGFLSIGNEDTPNAFRISSNSTSTVFSVNGTNVINFITTAIRPYSDNSINLGTTSLAWKEGFINELGRSGVSLNNINRKLRDRFSDIANVKDFGAVGDGVTDDAAAFSAAVSAAGGAGVYVPAGTYVVNSDVSGNLFCFGGVTISGTGVVSTLKDLTS